MTLIKLGDTASTNNYLKELASKQPLENFTTVTAENQTQGKGQMGSHWNSEAGKNLIMSILIKNFLTDSQKIFNLNIIISVAVIQALSKLNAPKLSIKWPNDIMSDQKKIGGILIENIFKSDGNIQSVVGLGLNVNQIDFTNLPNASSLALICKINFDREILRLSIVEKITENVAQWGQISGSLWEIYSSLLFKKGILMSFEDANSNQFTGIINGVTACGKLEILRENDLLSEYNIKEISMLY